MQKRDVIVDAGVLISLTSSCLDNLLYFFAEKHNLRFIIPPSVENEAVTVPLKKNIRKYLFSAIRIKNAIDAGVVVVVDAKLTDDTKNLMNLANNIFFARGRPLRLIHMGESEMLILAKQLGVEYILMDERTTRILIEAPILLKEHFEKEFHVNIMVNQKNLQKLTNEIGPLRTLRTSELVMLAYEKGYFKSFEALEKNVLEAALYKIKYSGCSIGFKEIKEYMSGVR
ncbi:hypothetical protein KKE92_00400 [Candidatus Micrarchaeota archaeon]|nr:hypothetical protein [Candidatus Micrarchaeota archaeon]MBU1681710.1 hypothetical protein [Candidatus Micrarchaeota archaeon]